MIVINGNPWMKMYPIATYVLSNVLLKRHEGDSEGSSDRPHPTSGDAANKNMDDHDRITEPTKAFIVNQVWYLKGHLMAVNLSTLTSRMLMFEIPPKRRVKNITTEQGIGACCFPIPSRTVARSGMARAACSKSAIAKFAK